VKTWFHFFAFKRVNLYRYNEGRWEGRGEFKGRPAETPQEYAARKAAANRVYVHFRDGDGRLDLVDEFVHSQNYEVGPCKLNPVDP
jgi:hypothetical protein